MRLDTRQKAHNKEMAQIKKSLQYESNALYLQHLLAVLESTDTEFIDSVFDLQSHFASINANIPQHAICHFNPSLAIKIRKKVGNILDKILQIQYSEIASYSKYLKDKFNSGDKYKYGYSSFVAGVSSQEYLNQYLDYLYEYFAYNLWGRPQPKSPLTKFKFKHSYHNTSPKCPRERNKKVIKQSETYTQDQLTLSFVTEQQP